MGVTPGWPDDPDTVAEAREHPEVFAGKGIREIADYEEAIIRCGNISRVASAVGEGSIAISFVHRVLGA